MYLDQCVVCVAIYLKATLLTDIGNGLLGNTLTNLCILGNSCYQ